MTSESSNIIRVKLLKQPRYGLGFLIRHRSKSPHVVVSDLVSGGMAAQSGLVQIGDLILKVNDTDLVDKSYDESLEILKSLPINSPVVIVLRGPEGYTSHLETRFQNDGTPRTIRVTKPVVSQDSFMDRIKKTFAGSASPKPCRSKQTQANCFCTTNNPTSCSHDQHANKQSVVNKTTNPCSFSVQGQNEPHISATTHLQRDESNGVVVKHDHKNYNQHRNQPEMSLTSTLLNSTQFINTLNESNDAELKKDGCTTNESVGAKTIVSDNVKVDITRGELIGEQGDMDDKCSGIKTSLPNGPLNSPAIVSTEVSDISRQSGGERYRGSDSQSSAKMPLQNGNNNNNNNNQSVNWNGDVSHAISDGKEVNQSKNALEVNRQPRTRESSPSRKFVRLRCVGEERPVCTDTLHTKAKECMPCTTDHCLGSVMDQAVKGTAPRPKEEVLVQAKDFIDQYYVSIKRQNTPAHVNRWQEVVKCIQDTGIYELTTAELTYGAKTAWRNSPRCIGRIQWSKLQVFDARHITTARGMFEAICNHIKYGTNKGNIRSAITIFPPRTDGNHDFRVWNPQLIRYAGYKQDDGTVIGDPSNVTLTEICQKLGWKGKGTRFDILPLLLQANGHDPEMFEIPSDLVLEVPIKHPKFPWFIDMGLKWYALPAVSSMMLDCGGLQFVGAPFNGWYMGTEIGARDFCDKFRYNLLEDIAERMGFDTRKSSSLWKDRTLVEVNVAVLYSYQSMGVTIIDHHSASESFMKHLDNEQKLRGGCPADWVWIVPPMSGSIMPVFHQEMLVYKLKPNYEYQEEPWKTHVWKKNKEKPKTVSDKPRRKIGFRELARAVKFSAKLMGKALARRVKCMILYATETGKSEGFSKTLCQIFKHAFDARVMCMDEYDISELEHEALVLIVTSTFGNGDPPENGEEFAKAVHEMKHPESSARLTSYLRMRTSVTKKEDNINKNSIEDNLTLETGPLSNVRYSVFGLGSSAYPHFCAFGHYMDNIFQDLGAERISKMVEGDELCGQEESFRNWAQEIFRAACETFCVGDEKTLRDAAGDLSKTDFTWSPEKFRITPASGDKEINIIDALSQVHGKPVAPCKFVERTQLQSPKSDRKTILIKLDTQGAEDLNYSPGDHVAIYPENSPSLVDAILIRLHNAPPPDQLIQVEILNERTTPLGSVKTWDAYKKIPVCTLRTAFARFLDITTPPSQTLLKIISAQATKDCDREKIENLTNDPDLYEEWKFDSYPNIVHVLDEFPSLRLPPSLLLTQLPLLQQRYYSISSSPKMSPGTIDATVAVVSYRTQGNAGPLHEGVCSTWLNKQEVGSTIPCVVRQAPAFHLPEDGTKPIILVGPGTGIAPFRSFWQQRRIDMQMMQPPQRGSTKGWGDIYLYFGCRNNNIDNIYKEELQKAKERGVIKEVYIALSREPNQPKTYVQDILTKNSADVYRTIVIEEGHFYVCGDVKMASDVTETLENIIVTEGKMTTQDAKDYVLKLRDGDRFHEDIFGVTLRSSEVTDRARDQAKKAWKFINAAGKSNKVKGTVATIPTDEIKAPRRKPRAPQKTTLPSEIKT